MRVRIFGYFYQESNTCGETLDLLCQDQLSVAVYVPLPTSATIYKIQHPDDLCVIDTFDEIWETEESYGGLQWFHDICENMKRCDECPWRPFTGTDCFDAEEEKDLPCYFFYHSGHEETKKTRPCPYITFLFPFYVFPAEPPITNTKDTKLYWYVVHPDENERMERILNGTDNPLYDLVHELRYNPAISSGLSTERKEAKDRFEENTGQKRARIDNEET